MDYESCIRYEIDNSLDIIHIFKDEKGYCIGAELRYIDNEHKKSSLQFRLKELKVFNTNEISEDKAIADSKKILNSLFDSDDFKNRRGKGYKELTFQQVLFAKLPSRN